MDSEMKQLADQLRGTFENDLKPRIEGNERDTAETKQAIDRVNDRLDEIEARAQKAFLAPTRTEIEASQERKDLMEFTRKGRLPSNPRCLRSVTRVWAECSPQPISLPK